MFNINENEKDILAGFISSGSVMSEIIMESIVSKNYINYNKREQDNLQPFVLSQIIE